MTERDLKEYMKGIEKDSEQRRAAGSPPAGDASVLGDVERREGAVDMRSGSGTQGRRASQSLLTQSAGVSKHLRSGSGTNEQPGSTRAFTRSQKTRTRSLIDGTSLAGVMKVEELRGGVDRMSISDSEL